jgi:hypothetical protein
VLWRFPTGDLCASGAAVSRGMVFWGTGYKQLGVPDLDGGGKLYAFGLPCMAMNVMNGYASRSDCPNGSVRNCAGGMFFARRASSSAWSGSSMPSVVS